MADFASRPRIAAAIVFRPVEDFICFGGGKARDLGMMLETKK
jgi:hypothetical protein